MAVDVSTRCDDNVFEHTVYRGGVVKVAQYVH